MKRMKSPLACFSSQLYKFSLSGEDSQIVRYTPFYIDFECGNIFAR